MSIFDRVSDAVVNESMFSYLQWHVACGLSRSIAHSGAGEGHVLLLYLYDFIKNFGY